MALLHLHKLVQAHKGRVIRQVHEEQLGDGFQVCVDAVLHQVVHGDYKLLELVELLPASCKEGLDVHRSPSEGHHARAHLVFEVFDMGLHHVGHDRLHHLCDTAVLPQEEAQLGVVHLELLLLQEDHPRGFGHLDVPHAAHAASLANEHEDLRVEIDMEAIVVFRMLNDQGRLQTRLDGLDRIHPGLKPQSLEFDKCLRHLVVHTNELLRILRSKDRRVALELVHRAFDSLVQVPGPSDVACNRRQVSDDRGPCLALLVLVLDLVQLVSVVVEDDSKL
mmetsp:Transcript_56296/g.182834  ORF Transcript_56296/g.182834 Transcript_56296/m.182834 type:complete len:278 (-) Transcript_56296:1141-1974(-)